MAQEQVRDKAAGSEVVKPVTTAAATSDMSVTAVATTDTPAKVDCLTLSGAASMEAYTDYRTGRPGVEAVIMIDHIDGYYDRIAISFSDRKDWGRFEPRLMAWLRSQPKTEDGRIVRSMLVECFVYLRCFSDKVRREDIPYVDIYIANPFDIGFLRMKIRDEKTKVYFCDCAKERLNVTARTSR